MTEEKFLETVILKTECCLPRIFDCVGAPNDDRQYEQVIYWFYNIEDHTFCLQTCNSAKKNEVTLAKINASSDEEAIWMKDSLEEYMNFNIPKYFESFKFVVRGYRVTCTQTEQNTSLACTFFFSK